MVLFLFDSTRPGDSFSRSEGRVWVTFKYLVSRMATENWKITATMCAMTNYGYQAFSVQRCASLCGTRLRIMVENIALKRLCAINSAQKVSPKKPVNALRIQCTTQQPNPERTWMAVEETSSRKSHNWDNYNFIIMMRTGRLISFQCIIYTTMLIKSTRLLAKCEMHFVRFRRPSATAYPEPRTSARAGRLVQRSPWSEHHRRTLH